MAKIMLVEDDNNLREIYEASLAAEGYEIVSARDGEEALALAIKEKPDLIVADIMMPKVSGLDMLDILRTTPETKDCKIIMMTALSQAEDKARAEKLGANRYLVKSQVTLEDVVRVAAELLASDSPGKIGDVPVEKPDASPIDPATVSTPVVAGPPAPTPEPVATAPTAVPATDTPTVAPTSVPVVDAPSAPAVVSAPVVDAPTDTTPTTTDEPVTTADSNTTDTTPTSVPTASSIPVTVVDDSTADENPADAPVETEAAPATEPERKTITITDTPEAEKPEEPKNEEDKKPNPDELSATTKTETSELEKKVESFIAGNPTLTTSAEPEKDKTESAVKPTEEPKPEPAEPGDTPKADGVEAEETIANAVDSLSKDGNATDTSTDKPKENENGISVAAPKEMPDSITGDNDGMKHTKVIEPPTDFKNIGPDLEALLAKEDITMDSATPEGPAAHTVISPDGVPVTGPAPNVITPNAPSAPGSDISPTNADNIAL